MTPDPSPRPASARGELKGERWSRLKELFQEALELPTDQREAWIARAAADDPDLRRELEVLIASHDTADGFLERPPLESVSNRHVFARGTRLGQYEIVDELGRGGGGIVYLAQDQRLGRLVALKLVAAGADSELRERLRREARAAATITHPAVATIYALEEFDDQLFIVSEYVRGRTLRAALGTGPLRREDALRIARQIGDALQAAHDAGVIHRDLKPENVMLADNGAVKVVDFGIARMNDGAPTQLTRHGALLGTPAYMAPEQLLGTPADVRADIYAFGIVLSEMLTGRHPGLATSPPADHVTAGELTLIARRCMQVDPSARIQTAGLLVAALDAAHAGIATGRSQARWWWAFHQTVIAILYVVMLWPTWMAREAIGGPLGRTVFIAVLAAVVVSTFLRLHLLFTSRFYPAELAWVRHRARPWITAGDVVFAAVLMSAPLLVRGEHSSLDLMLMSVGIGSAIAFLVIEVATARAAFPPSI